MAGLAADGYPVRSDVHRGTRHDGQKPGIASKKTQCQRTREGAKDGGGTIGTAVHRRLCRRWAQLALPMVRAAQLGGVGSCGAFLGVLPLVCGGAARKHLPLADHRSSGASEGDRHRSLWHRSSSDVHGHNPSIHDDAFGIGLAYLLRHHAALSPPHR